MFSRTISGAAILIGAVALTLVSPLAASAHVTIDKPSAEPGSYTTLNVKVPTEMDIPTTKITMTIPEHEGLNASYAPVAGWDTVVTGQGDSPDDTVIVWTAQDGQGIAEGQFLMFPISLGAVPDVDKLVLSVDQEYSDGTVVSWSETEEEAEKPAPILYVNEEAPNDHHGSDDATVEATETASSSTDDDVLARVFGIGGLALGAAALVIALQRRKAARS